MITRIVTPVTSGEYGMFVGIRGRKTYWANRLLHFTPILGGERALRKALWDHVPPDYKRNFQIEIALNFFAKQLGQPMGFTVVHGLSQVIKEKKRGLLPGLWQRCAMIRDIRARQLADLRRAAGADDLRASFTERENHLGRIRPDALLFFPVLSCD